MSRQQTTVNPLLTQFLSNCYHRGSGKQTLLNGTRCACVLLVSGLGFRLLPPGTPELRAQRSSVEFGRQT